MARLAAPVRDSAGMNDRPVAHVGGAPLTFELLVDSVVDYAIIALDPQGVVQSWNRGAERLKGYQPTEIEGQHFSIFYSHEDRMAGLPSRMLDTARRQGRVQDQGWRVRKDGTRFWADVVITTLRGDEGDLRGFVKVTRDLTERHEAEQRLTESETRFRLLVESVVDYAFVGLDPQGVVTTWNRGARALKGYDAAEIIGRHFSVFYSEEDRAAGVPIWMLDEARAHGRVERAGWRIRRDGSRFWADVVITAIVERDEVKGFVKVTRDRTAAHQAQEGLEAALGRFAELAHDLRQPLGVIYGYASLLRDQPQLDEASKEMIKRLEVNAGRMREMADSILDFSRLTLSDRTVSPIPIELAPVTARAIDLLDHVQTEIVVEVSPDLEVMADPAAIERILLNLLTNACKHSPPGARVIVAADEAADHVAVTVEDFGPGMSETARAALFTPFASGEVPGSVGLGLSIVRRYIELHRGTICAEAKDGPGTLMRFTLPRP